MLSVVLHEVSTLSNSFRVSFIGNFIVLQLAILLKISGSIN